MSETVPERSYEWQKDRAKKLASEILSLETKASDLRIEAQALPREALIESAWQGLANYRMSATISGVDHPRVKAFEAEVDARLSLLTEEECRRAEALSTDWLDENFDK